MRKRSEEGKMLGELRHRAAEDDGSEWRRLRGDGGEREREREREELCDINGGKNDVILA